MHDQFKIIDLSLDLTQIMVNKELMSLEIAKLGHIGTHIDIMDKADLPLNYFITEAYLVDVSMIHDREIMLSDTTIEELNIQPGQSLLFRTNWLRDKQYGNKQYFTGHPFFHYNIIDYLISKKIAIIGVDAPGMRRSLEHKVLDQYCVDQEVFILENIENMEKIPCNTLFTLCCFPLKLSNMTGATCRAVAILK